MSAKRRVILSAGVALWEAGDAAKTIALVEGGKLGVKAGGHLVGVIWPNMALGEASILTLEGEDQRRTAAIVALDEGTVVNEYPVDAVKATFAGSTVLASQILATLLGQICRNCLLVMSSSRETAHLSLPAKGLMKGCIQAYRPFVQSLTSWDAFMAAFRVLYRTRDYTGDIRRQLIGWDRETEALEKASLLARELLKGEDAVPGVEDYLNADRELGERRSEAP